MSSSPITVHYLERSRAFRIVWALEELQLRYDLKYYARNETGLAPEALKQAHPLGVSPIIEVDGKKICESGAILNYLQRRYDSENQFRATSEEALLEYDFWDHFAEGTVMPLVVFTFATNKLDSDSVPTMVRMMTKKIKENMQLEYSHPRLEAQVKFIEAHLKERRYFSNSKFSFADIQMSYALGALIKLGYIQAKDHSSPVVQYLERVCSRPAFIRAAQRCPDLGGVLDDVVPRDPGHVIHAQ